VYKSKEDKAAYDKAYRKANCGKIHDRRTSEEFKASRRKYRTEHPEQGNNSHKRWILKYPDKHLLSRAKIRAKKKGIPFDLEVSDIIVPFLCPVLGIELNIGMPVMHPQSPTVDRIDNSKGYIKGNIAVISWRANKLKSDGNLEEFRLILDYMENHNG
jgi:hypothetical protein